jgi:predicted metal-dependent peptidase
MNLNVAEGLVQARIDLLLDFPFYGNLAMNLPLVENNSIPTFATDYKKVYYNKEFAGNITREDKRFILAHEVLHCAFLHGIRKGERDMERWNFATDYAINAILNKDFGFVPKGGLYSEKFVNMTAEEIYNKLPDMANKKKAYRIYDNGDMKIEIDKEGNIKVDGKEVKPFDTHMDVKGSKDELDDLEKQWVVNVSKAYQQAKMAGKLPGGMKVFIDKLLEPKLDWRNMLRQFVITTARSDFRWHPPSKRHLHEDMYMPSMSDESLGEVAVVVDVSGSTSGKEQQQFFSECNGLLNQYNMNLHLLTTDTEVTSHREYQQGDEIKRTFIGNGGTELSEAFLYIDKKRINPNVVVVLTDGYTDMKFKSKYPSLWVITKGGVDLKDVPFKMKVKMND